MEWPKLTGEVSRLLEVREHRLNYLIRAGKVQPQNTCGRRLWWPKHVLAAARLLDRDSVPLRRICAEAREAAR